ncbi:hypothetical protein BOW35_11565 [Solemya velum gill symbiont]|uniref:6-carboxytetrahydropterin synthase n=1 Tax=Solemya velum gill symbiont TaxID=2340 RepID=UPI000998AF1E|nr:6-carboxytetrahydropterin synthase [Solemya velum gill symbiont]OOZ13038.1 hypothetical protein BOW27_10380 [Solemya velum gill symbiont]OOZ22245.1 hypothetical protein BOW31_11485 [Solemya velum gill symbiont]OOZ27807.1 hypothetical protein BOW33_10930 [Solemya velum gill symbiont]OOZ30359.1 hypothetical protein BOW34_11555 [Solemya velum gill symbiont]OOZ32448.1 hypothetical protein BOW35_11565 [Solemya velum gill symbiont]
MSVLFVNDLTSIDFSYLHNQRGLLGESLSLGIRLSGSLDEQGMVLDFADVKRQVKQLVDEHFDHKLIAPARSSQLSTDTWDNRIELKFRWGDNMQLKHVSPAEAVSLLDVSDVTPGTLATAIAEMLQERLPENISEIEINLSEEVIDESSYQYSHGLKHHAGNCQRIAHGHRSRIIIYRNGTRSIELEEEWADRWDDIYIGSLEDLADASDECHHYAYSSSQGNFELTLPAVCCDLINADSTVENIAEHIAEQLKSSHPESRFEVHAYEGMDKGAIATS